MHHIMAFKPPIFDSLMKPPWHPEFLDDFASDFSSQKLPVAEMTDRNRKSLLQVFLFLHLRQQPPAPVS